MYMALAQYPRSGSLWKLTLFDLAARADFYDARSTVSLDTRDETTDYGIFNLDLDIDCLKMLAGKEPSSDSGEANSDHSTFTDEAKVIVGQTLAQTAHSPRSPSATSPNHATTIAINGADEDDGELLLSHAPSFNLEESEIIAAGIYPFLIPPASADGRSSNKGNMISSAIKRSKPSIGGVGFGAHRGAPLRRCSSQLKLTLNYGAAVEMINTALDVHGDRKVPGHIGTPSIGEFNDIQAGDMIASTPLEGSLKRRRDPEV